MIVPPAWGIPVILVLGSAVVFFGWWWDRRATRLATEGFTSQDQVDADAVASPDDAELAALTGRLAEAVTVPTSCPAAFRTTAAPRAPGDAPRDTVAALVAPLVLLADAELSDPLALVPALRHARAEGRPLVLVARGLDAAILDTLDANARTGRVRTLPLTASAAALAQLSELTAATPLDSQDWASGWLPATAWGGVAGWVADADRSWLLLAE